MPLNVALRREWWNQVAWDRDPKQNKNRKIEKLDLRVKDKKEGPKYDRYRGRELNYYVVGYGVPDPVMVVNDVLERWNDPQLEEGGRGFNEPGLVVDFPPVDELDEDGFAMPIVSVGADPEFFLKDRRNRNISAHGIVPGTKREPHKLKHGAIQLDGTAVEFNIAPATSPMEFKKNIQSVLGEVRAMVPERYRFNFSPSVKYSKEYFKKIPEGCKELGCDPDFDAYTYGKPNERPDNKTTMRTGAGHLHIGWDADAKLDTDDRSHVLDCCLLAKNLDAVFSMIEKNWDDDNQRRSMYGKLGAFRPKPYGMEYRSLSNAWVRYPKLWPFLFNICKSVYAHTLRGSDLSQVFNLPGTLTPDQFNLYCKRVRKFTGFTFPTDFNKEVYGA